VAVSGSTGWSRSQSRMAAPFSRFRGSIREDAKAASGPAAVAGATFSRFKGSVREDSKAASAPGAAAGAVFSRFKGSVREDSKAASGAGAAADAVFSRFKGSVPEDSKVASGPGAAAGATFSRFKGLILSFSNPSSWHWRAASRPLVAAGRRPIVAGTRLCMGGWLGEAPGCRRTGGSARIVTHALSTWAAGGGAAAAVGAAKAGKSLSPCWRPSTLLVLRLFVTTSYIGRCWRRQRNRCGGLGSEANEGRPGELPWWGLQRCRAPRNDSNGLSVRLAQVHPIAPERPRGRIA